MFQRYAEVYDLIYQDKDYPRECDFLEGIFEKYAKAKVRRVLDVAAGTGGHANLLGERGYEVQGYDLSVEMARIAGRKARGRARFEGGISMTDLPNQAAPWDAVLCLFSSINYLRDHREVERFFAGAGKALKPDGGLFVVEFWNGISCLRETPAPRTKEVEGEGLRVVRSSETKIDPMHNRAEVEFSFKVFPKGQDPVSFQEKHLLRYYFPQEICDGLERAGFTVLAVHPFGDLERPANENDRDVVVIARRSSP